MLLLFGGGIVGVGYTTGCGNHLKPPVTTAPPLSVQAVTPPTAHLPTPGRGAAMLPKTVVPLPFSLRFQFGRTLPSASKYTGAPLSGFIPADSWMLVETPPGNSRAPTQ